MAMGTRKVEQTALFLTAEDLPEAPTLPFFEKLNEGLAQAGFDDYVEGLCRSFYDDRLGRPSLAPGVYFRLLLLGFLLGLDSERRIALQACDSLSLRRFLGYALQEATPDHSTLSRTRRRIPVETHEQVFGWVLGRLREAGLARGKAVAVDSTTLEANAALETLRRKDTGESYREFVVRLAEEAGEQIATVGERIEYDRGRPGKSLSNKDWESKTDPDAKVAKRKDGGTDMAHQAEHVVDLESGALLGVTVQGAELGDTQRLGQTLAAAEAAQGEKPAEVAADKGYHSAATLQALEADGQESYVPEPKRKRNWDGKEEVQKTVEANRERVGGERGRELGKQRTEKAERSMAHMYGSGGLRRVYLRGHENIRKRLLIHACGYNLGVWMRSLTGIGTPRSLQGQGLRVARSVFAAISALETAIAGLVEGFLGGWGRIRSARAAHGFGFAKASEIWARRNG